MNSTARISDPFRLIRPQLLWALWAVMALHAIVILALRDPAVISNLCIAATALLAALCCLWRAAQLDQQERPPWLWIAVGFLVWSAAQLIFTHVAGKNWDFGPGPEISDLLFFDALIPLFLAISNTYETQAAASVVYLNVFQAAMATGLTYVCVFRVHDSAAVVLRNLYKVYWGECLLLAIASALRLLTWSTLEERRRARLLCATLWLYLLNWRPPSRILFGIPLKAPKGTLWELVWCVPFVFMGCMALSSPVANLTRRKASANPRALLLRSLFPLMITGALFGLALSVAREHFYLGLGAVLLLLLAQGVHSGVIQVSYLMGQVHLLTKEKELKAANLELEKQSMLDPLTGISNRRYFAEAFAGEWKRASRKGESVAIVMLDLDYFKGVNDAHGHPYGDSCLVEIAGALRRELRRSMDVVARYGGEEFIVLLPDTDQEGATTIAVYLQSAIAGLNLVNKASPFDQQLTVSLGVAVMRASTTGSREELIARADHALYRAKGEGRNRICFENEPTFCPNL